MECQNPPVFSATRRALTELDLREKWGREKETLGKNANAEFFWEKANAAKGGVGRKETPF